MRSNPFRTAQLRSKLPVSKLAAGVFVAALALTASARDSGAPIVQHAMAPIAVQPARPHHKSLRWIQVGLASWYGTHFQGRTTANGEEFDMNRMTCAHPTLPMGTWLRVTNLKNRETTFVRVNDRGPVTDGRIVDLSAAAASVIGLSGVGKVRLEQVRPTDPELAVALVSQLRPPAEMQIENQ